MTEVVVNLPDLIKAKVIDLETAQKFFGDWLERGSYLWNRHGAWDVAGAMDQAKAEEPKEASPAPSGAIFQPEPAGEPSDGDGGDPQGDQATNPGDLPWNPR